MKKNILFIFCILFFSAAYLSVVEDAHAQSKQINFMDINQLKDARAADKIIIFFPRVYLPESLKKFEGSFRAHMAHLFFGTGKIQVSYAPPPKKKYPARYSLEKKKIRKVAPTMVIDAKNKKEYAEEIKSYEKTEESVVEYEFLCKVTKTALGYQFFFTLADPYSHKKIAHSPTYATSSSLQELVHKMRVHGFGFLRGEKSMNLALANGFLQERIYTLQAAKLHKKLARKKLRRRKKQRALPTGVVRIYSVPANIPYKIGGRIRGHTNNEHNLVPGKHTLTIYNILTKKKENYPFFIYKDKTKFFNFNFQKSFDLAGMVASVGKVIREEDAIEDEEWVGASQQEMQDYYADLKRIKQAEKAEQKRWNEIDQTKHTSKKPIASRNRRPRVYVGIGFRYLGAQPSKTQGTGPTQALELEVGFNYAVKRWKFGIGQNSINFTNGNDQKTYAKKYKYLSAAREFTWLNNLVGRAYLDFDFMSRFGLAEYNMINASKKQSTMLASIGGQIIFWNVLRLIVDLEFTLGSLPPPYAENAPLISPAAGLAVGWGF